MRKFKGSVVAVLFLLLGLVTTNPGQVEAKDLEKLDYSHGIIQVSSVLNVRSGPGNEYGRIGQLNNYDRVELEGKTLNGWYKIKAEGISGDAYVWQRYVVPVDLPEQDYGYATANLNVRSGPSTSYERVGRIVEGERVDIVGQIGNWYKLKFDHISGPTYVSGNYISFENPLEIKDPERSHGIIQVSSVLNVRSGPGNEYGRIGQLNNYDRVELEGKTLNGWYKIKAEGISGDAYVWQRYVVLVDLPEQDYGYATANLNVRSGPSTSYERVGRIVEGERVDIVGQIGNWYKLKFDHISGPTYVSGNYISFENPLEIKDPERSHGIIQVSSVLNVRSGPGNEYRRIGQLNNYDRVELEGKTLNGWYKIKAEGISGDAYVWQRYVVPVDLPEQDYGYATANLNVRSGPSTSYERVGRIVEGERVDIVGQIGNWYKLKFDHISGPTYVSGSYITFNPNELIEPEKSHGIVQVSSALNVRSGPGNEYRRIGQLNNYDRVELEGKTLNGWYKIKAEGINGDAYVWQSYIVPVDLPSHEHGLVVSNLKVRKGPSTSYDHVYTLNRFERVHIVGVVNGWYKIKLDHVNGPTYVSARYVDTDGAIFYTQYDRTFEEALAIQMTLAPQTTTPRGFVHRNYIDILDKSRGKVSLKDPNSMLNVRSFPDSSGGSSTVIHQLRHGQLVSIISEYGNWLDVTYSASGQFHDASIAAVKEFLDPNNHDIFQHLILTTSVGVSASELNKVLSGKGILDGKAQAFIDGGRTYSVNEAYLIAHAILETGHGTSILANGVEVGLNEGGAPELVKSSNRNRLTNIRKTYNIFGINAADDCPVECGAKRAYVEKWFSPEEAIKDGARFIADRYIHNRYGQNTLYKMRWNPANPGYPQYATDIGWAVKQVPHIKNIYNRLTNPVMYFDIPQYR